MKKLLFCLSFLTGFTLIAQDKNVVFIIIDDLKPLINSFGENQMITPNLDKLASESVVFTNAQCQQAVCAPSRISFMTGMRPDYTRVWDLKTKMRDMNPDILTIPQYFKNNGYNTLGMGKVFHGARKNDPDSWSQPFIQDADLPYAKGYQVPANMDYQSEESQNLYSALTKKYAGEPSSKTWRVINKEFKQAGVRKSFEAIDVPDAAYADGAIALESIQQMKKLSKSRKPFFITIGFHKPHLPFVAPKKYWDLYDRDEIDLAAYQKQADGAPDYAYHNFGELKNFSDIPPSLTPEGEVKKDKQKELIHGYYAAVSYVDAQVGKVVDYLEASGLKTKTSIVLVGDHGWHLGDHGLWNKHSNYEQATRTPLMIYSSDKATSRQISSPVELIDIFPSLCDLSGLEIPKGLQGESLMPILNGTSDEVKKVALSQYPRLEDRMGYAVRNNRYRYIMWYSGDFMDRANFDASRILAEELYDYTTDPLEKASLHDRQELNQVKEELKQQLISTVWNREPVKVNLQDRIAYKKVDTTSLDLWTYLPDNHDVSKKYPAVLFFHGGGWNGGSPKSFQRQARYFASRGVVAFSAEYRIKNIHETTPFDATEDAKDAFDFLVTNAESLGIDPSRIVVGGGSAGGQLATATWFWNNDGLLPAAMLLFNPVLDMGENGFAHKRMEGRHMEISPLDNVAKNHPPTLIMVGTKDRVLPVKTAEAYKRSVENVGGLCKIKFYEDQEHSFFNKKAYYKDTLLEADLFLIELGLIGGEPLVDSSLRIGK